MQIPTSGAWLALVRQRRAQTYAAFAAQQGVSVLHYRTAVEARVRAWVHGGEVRVRVRAHVLPLVLQDGRLKNQFETGTSGGLLNLPSRIATEAALFQIPASAAAADRPVYGYLEGTLEPSVVQYGVVVLGLNNDVRARTTFTLADSLDHTNHGTDPYVAPSPLNNPTVDAAFTEVDISGAPDVASATGWGYVECQIHGGVSVADIARVVFTQGVQPDPAIQQSLANANLQWSMTQGVEP